MSEKVHCSLCRKDKGFLPASWTKHASSKTHFEEALIEGVYPGSAAAAGLPQLKDVEGIKLFSFFACFVPIFLCWLFFTRAANDSC
jgi:hypothetical protein